MKKSVILITGVTTGFGKASLDYLSEQGHTVYGTTRNRQNYLAKNGFGNESNILEVDLTCENSILKCIGHIISKEGQVDVLVNNAGFGIGGPIDDISIAYAEDLFKINFFAPLMMIQAVLPHMRALKSGLIINISSLAGQLGIPYAGLYSASKFALEGLSESLAIELRGAGINVVLIEPGDSKTGFSANRLKIQTSKLNEEEQKKAQQVMDMMETEGSSFFPPEQIASLIEKIISDKSPRLRYTIGPTEQVLTTYLKRFIPFKIYESLINKMFKM